MVSGIDPGSVEYPRSDAPRLGRARLRDVVSARRRAYGIFLIALLATELIVLTPPPDAVSHVEQAGFWGWFLSAALHQIRPAFLSGLCAAVFLSWPTLQQELRQTCAQCDEVRAKRIPWLMAHLVLVGMLLAARTSRASNSAISLIAADAWLWLWTAMALPVLATWALAALPPRFWIAWLARCRGAFVAGAVFGAVADFLGGSTEALWWPLQRLTFRIVIFLLRVCGQATIVDPQRFTVGTPHFSVQIWAQCSGLEGIGLMSAFLVAYLWLFRRELQFPKAFLLLPVGAIAIWLMNAVRITALILIGNWDPGLGFKGFHSVAGWLFFNSVACGLIWASWRFSFFTRPAVRSVRGSVSNPAGVYLVPLLAIIGVAMITHAFSGGFEILYPLRVFAAASAFWFYRGELMAMRWRASSLAIVLGTFVFLLWIALAHSNGKAEATTTTALGRMPAYLTAGWFFFRIVGSVATVPLAEELAFRGYLIRKFVSYDFASVDPRHFTWTAFLGTSILFGMLHGEWLAGTLAGMAFAFAVYRRGRLSDAVFAHATANGLLSAYTLATGNWSLWS